jgi:hypothetical protein
LLDTGEFLDENNIHMRTIAFQCSSRILAVGALACALGCLPSSSRADDEAPLTARVIHLTGAVRYSLNGSGWKMLKKGATLKPGVVIQTAKEKSSVDIELGEAGNGEGNSRSDRAAWEEPSVNLVRLFEDSALEIRKLTARGAGAQRVEETDLNLRAGQVLGAVRRLSGGSHYEITIPNGVAGVQPGVAEGVGTVYVLKTSGALTAISGTMLMARVDGEVHTQIVTAGQQLDPGTGVVVQLAPDAPEKKLWPP